MTIQYKFFHIPVCESQESEDELNRFLRSVKVLQTDRKFVEQGTNSFWSFTVEYYCNGKEEHGTDNAKREKNRADYKKILSPEDFSLFVKLREWRKNVATEEGIPLYAILNNEQLAIIAEKRITNPSDLRKIEGIGEGRITKYAENIIRIVTEDTAAGIREQ